MIFRTVDARELPLSETELAARLMTPVGTLPEGFEKCFEAVVSAARPAFSAVRLPLRFCAAEETGRAGTVYIGASACKSSALVRVLDGCEEAVLLCATLGISSERLLRKYSAGGAHLHFIADAVADALTEALCDRAEELILEGSVHTARFSPGYADLTLEFVREIVRVTEAERLLGVKLTESMLAVPSKTVSAIIGIKGNLKPFEN